jgi:ADP-ribosyl-[dinitrogen reductase] hydrolase
MSIDRTDRIAGILLGSAVGDALGVPYEFAAPPGPSEVPEMRGGGLGNYAPGEWSDDTQMAACILLAAVDHPDLSDPRALNFIADKFMDWFQDGPADIGNQTAAVLRSASYIRFKEGWCTGGRMAEIAHNHAQSTTSSAGNGALMRTGPVAAANLHDRDAAASAARKIAALTHADPLCEDSCVLWVEAIRVAATEDRFDFRAGLDLIDPDRWAKWNRTIISARHAGDAVPGVNKSLPPEQPGSEFNPNGFTLTAMQAAIAAIAATPVPEDNPRQHFTDALCNAIRIGDDTDTVAAIAGALLGARWGAQAIPPVWRDAVHGWPGLTGADLYEMARTLAGRS